MRSLEEYATIVRIYSSIKRREGVRPIFPDFSERLLTLLYDFPYETKCPPEIEQLYLEYDITTPNKFRVFQHYLHDFKSSINADDMIMIIGLHTWFQEFNANPTLYIQEYVNLFLTPNYIPGFIKSNFDLTYAYSHATKGRIYISQYHSFAETLVDIIHRGIRTQVAKLNLPNNIDKYVELHVHSNFSLIDLLTYIELDLSYNEIVYSSTEVSNLYNMYKLYLS